MTRVSGLVKAELGRLIARERLFEDLVVTVTSVEVAPDLRNAYIHVSHIGGDITEEQLVTALEKAAPEWQREISHRLHIKYTPRLNFRYDPSLARGDRVMEILHEIEDLPPADDDEKSD